MTGFVAMKGSVAGISPSTPPQHLCPLPWQGLVGYRMGPTGATLREWKEKEGRDRGEGRANSVECTVLTESWKLPDLHMRKAFLLRPSAPVLYLEGVANMPRISRCT